MRLTLFLCLIATASAADIGVTTLDPQIAQIETGIICPPPVVGEAEAPGTVAGTTHLIDEDPPFLTNGHKVPAVLGIGFGAKARAVDPDGLGGVTMTVTHPPMGKDGVRQQSFVTSINGQQPSLTFYQFDHGYEVLIGTWTMEASRDGEVLYSATFKVVAPQLAPELASACGFEDLLG